MVRKPKLLVVGALVAAGCLTAGIAYAVIPSGGVISSCYLKSGGHCV